MAEQEQFPILIHRQGKPPEVFRFSKKQRDMIELFLQTGTYIAVARECKVKAEDVKAFLTRPEIQEHIKARYGAMAQKYSLTEEAVMSKIAEIINSDGSDKYSGGYLRALELATRVLKMIQPSSINVAQFINANPYSSLTDAELDKEITDRIDGGRD